MKHRKLETTPEISKRMSKVHLKRGKSETALAKALWHEGIRYCLNYKKLPGSPDIAITKYKIAVFVDGEFWHGYNWPLRKDSLQSNKDYWVEKIEENMARDARNDTDLLSGGWIVIRFWEKEVKSELNVCVKHVLARIEQVKRGQEMVK